MLAQSVSTAHGHYPAGMIVRAHKRSHQGHYWFDIVDEDTGGVIAYDVDRRAFREPALPDPWDDQDELATVEAPVPAAPAWVELHRESLGWWSRGAR